MEILTKSYWIQQLVVHLMLLNVLVAKTNRTIVRLVCFYHYLRNTFVLEYCGEVLDHKEFKTRVKEYARNKNIHYYFMSLKNNEVSDDVRHCNSQ